MKLLLNFVKLGSHPLADRLALHHKVLIPVLPADVRESQKIECFGFAFSSLYPVPFGKSPELNPGAAAHQASEYILSSTVALDKRRGEPGYVSRRVDLLSRSHTPAK
jgi:hypothetical protein